MTAPEASRYLELVPDGYDFDQRIAARFVLHIVLYSPGRNMRVLDVPVLVQVGSRDATIPPRPTVRAARRAPRSTLRIYASGHFEPHTGDMFEIVVADQLMFLDRHFRSDGQRTRAAAVTGTRVDIDPRRRERSPSAGWTLCAADVNDTALAALREELARADTDTALDVTDDEEASSRRSRRDPPSHGRVGGGPSSAVGGVGARPVR